MVPATTATTWPLEAHGLDHSRAAALAEFDWTLRQSSTPIVRPMKRFALEELVIPEGEHKDTKLLIHRQPWVGLLLDAIDSRRWRRCAVVGCVQSGKSLIGYVLPILYHLFEVKETVVCGVPTMEIAQTKWRMEILPVIKASRYRHLLPTRGPGSRGGTGNLEQVTFLHGPTLKFMSAHGGDEKRSSFTARVLSGTEIDKMDEAGEASRETDPVRQMEARLASYDEARRVVYLECTVSIERGRIWQEWGDGTASRIFCRHAACGEYVCPEREHLVGWREAADVWEARDHAHWACPACGEPITPAERAAMNQVESDHPARLVHRGQGVDARGRVEGDPPRADTLGFRWTAFNNLFWKDPAELAAMEWKNLHSDVADDEESPERELCQFRFVTPYQPPEWDETPLDARAVRKRFGRWGKGELPPDLEYLTMGVDLGKRVSWWILTAWRPGASGHIVDYGPMEVASDDLGVERAIVAALRDLRDRCEAGWLGAGDRRQPDRVFIDARYQTEAVFSFCGERASNRRYLPLLGCSASKYGIPAYHRPKKTGTLVKRLGEEYHLVYMPKYRGFAVEANSDYWKSWTHQRLAQRPDQDSGEWSPGAMTVYISTDKNAHITLSKHLTAEEGKGTFVPGRGTQVRWEQKRDANHYLDALAYACIAGHFAGVRLLPEEKPAVAAVPLHAQTRFTTPDGRPFVATER
ncbi:MAG TPA: terminase gpA endonuclease subunit [Phycisphaerae bacterium]|nr:terminase gpA endonuclease subunit [Phycisphaerae bacterium]